MNSGSEIAWLTFYATALLLVLAMLILAVLLFVQISRGRARRKQTAESEAARPILQDAFVPFLAGGKDETAIRKYFASQREDVVEALLLFQRTVGGSARDRLCQLALDLKLVQEWRQEAESPDVVRRRQGLSRLALVGTYEPCREVAGDLLARALKDPDEEVRLAAARGLVQAGQTADIERVFLLALGTDPLTRIVLTEDLRRHAMTLCAQTAPRLLGSGTLHQIRSLLEIVVAWERAIPLQQLLPLLEHRERDVRVLAFRLAPLAPPDQQNHSCIIQGLNDEDLEIRTLAVIAVDRMKITDALPKLALCMRRGPIDVARHAAAALANMSHTGWRTLEELSTGPVAVAAQAAREVLEKRKERA